MSGQYKENKWQNFLLDIIVIFESRLGLLSSSAFQYYQGENVLSIENSEFIAFSRDYNEVKFPQLVIKDPSKYQVAGLECVQRLAH